MDATITGFHHVKLPVSDVSRSREWYERVLGLALEIEFEEDGVVRGVALRLPHGGGGGIALREDPDHAAGLAGFDPVALLVPERDQVEQWRARLDELGVEHGGIVTGHHGGKVLVGLRDPDGLEIRLYAD
ncbi:VOC family protein [Actinomycetospora cinnamomea]|uniref:Glyoxalase/bleomycin resistance protein/dioxygenase superfamily protein n=1 Tax=Actinomycetospora cinnamomea TaxID=663609 RepID=A0A2U1FM79_9PSEU|nr:VOC family protein [Actinomycetospora cinnamomea]PVZ13301.1 glyoxalase/bleomycin resistance protein/dioxygenase superfamily protein [Actinomycetospora cinnamomea]